jgi:hypothetical protein
MTDLPEALIREIRTAFDEGVQFTFRKIVELCTDALAICATHHSSDERKEGFLFIKEWCETTMLEIAVDAPSAGEEVMHEVVRNEERQG